MLEHISSYNSINEVFSFLELEEIILTSLRENTYLKYDLNFAKDRRKYRSIIALGIKVNSYIELTAEWVIKYFEKYPDDDFHSHFSKWFLTTRQDNNQDTSTYHHRATEKFKSLLLKDKTNVINRYFDEYSKPYEGQDVDAHFKNGIFSILNTNQQIIIENLQFWLDLCQKQDPKQYLYFTSFIRNELNLSITLKRKIFDKAITLTNDRDFKEYIRINIPKQ